MSSFTTLWPSLSGIGRDGGTGGYRRYAWTPADLTLREWFTDCARQRGMDVEEDRNGNLWAWWSPPGWSGDPRGAFVTGSHLDSVPDGGAFDGPLGVVSGFAAVDVARQRGVVPSVPVAVVAFSDEEGARFGVACAGSRLSAGTLEPERALALRDNDGVTLAEALTRQGRDPHALGADPTLADRVGVFVELHVEQGRALDELDRPLAIGTAIWPHGRWRFSFAGQANHAGTTQLADRRDPMLAFASAVRAARTGAELHEAVATFGRVRVEPNGTNAIPSHVHAWLDARAATEPALEALVEGLASDAQRFAAEEGATVEVSSESRTPVVEFGQEPRRRLRRILGEVPELPTAAGHDAGVLSALVPTAMLFVRNPTGISHSPAEHAEEADCEHGARALAEVLIDWVTR
ncbi:allantoate amidohydrolase [Prauserella cavernicola]|uniref:Allantoate amidohydrolase n=1 Tax=Prauserella cavernicola TaxID=2800127 RepID=A0A934V695_9PSEU|nr:allantoate amidohydrolase [Prauserella cavernicola]MBK1785965.1 allantoate amidohydrolase [Prauserella cavernicola]